MSTKPPNWFRDGELPRLVKGAQLNGADLRHVTAIRAFLVNADLTWANLQGATLFEANLQGANLDRANLQGANLFMANLQGADLRGVRAADITPDQVKGATNWKLAYYSGHLLKKLRLPPNHNTTLPDKLAKLEKEKKSKAP